MKASAVLGTVLTAALARVSVAGSGKLSTWVKPGSGGPMGDDATQALAWVRQHKAQIGSLSIYGIGPPGPSNITGPRFNAELKAMGIDTYVLWGGQWSSFSTPAAIRGSVSMVLGMVQGGGFTGVDLDFEHPQTWGPDFRDPMNATFKAELTSKYSDFLRALSSALHAKGLKMSECVGSYPTVDGGISVYYDPAVVAETNDLVRVMNYDMYYVGGRGVPAIASRPDCEGMGPTSTAPWAKFSMQWWLERVPAHKLVMGIPAYSNDYSALPGHGGGNGHQAGVGPPASTEPMCGGNGTHAAANGSDCSAIETIWEYFDQINNYMYTDASGSPRIRYGTEVKSTRAHLRTATTLALTQVGFWTLNSANSAMVASVLEWAGE